MGHLTKLLLVAATLSVLPAQRVPPRTPNANENRIGKIGAVRIHATDEQREQALACGQLLERALLSVKSAQGNGDQLREQISSLNLEHDKLIAGLDKHQQEQLRDRTREMGRARDRVNAAFKKLSAELAKPKPDSKRVTEQATEMEQAMKPWQEQYRGLQADFQP